ncbi:MAG: hypothetical protein AB7E36_14190, partial [Salinivirgaceae bacterium]
MKARFTVTNKLVVGFGVLLFATVINGVFTYSTLNQSQELNEKILTIYNPSTTKLQELVSMINNSYMLTKNWVFIEKQSDTPDKVKLTEIHKTDFPKLNVEIAKRSVNWEPAFKRNVDS